MDRDRFRAGRELVPQIARGGRGRPAPAFIFAHGNGELIDYWPDELRPVAALGAGLLLVEYPGYGRSEGAPTQERILEVFTRAYDRLAARPEVDPGRIVLIGRSMGGGAVCDLALKRPSAALVLLSTFTSLRTYAVRYLAPGFLIRDPFDNLAAVRQYPGPVLVVHGREDDGGALRPRAGAQRGRAPRAVDRLRRRPQRLPARLGGFPARPRRVPAGRRGLAAMTWAAAPIGEQAA